MKTPSEIFEAVMGHEPQTDHTAGSFTWSDIEAMINMGIKEGQGYVPEAELTVKRIQS